LIAAVDHIAWRLAQRVRSFRIDGHRADGGEIS
jgi:hypothetical protein